jgi:catechol 2,3-dioxygenase-like lactoylglutathione lyase family enzyme
VRLELHHVGIVVRDVAESCALYVRRFGYEVKSPVIHEPTQTAHVQFLRLPGDRTFLELVAPDGPQSRLAGALAKGGGLNHVCYAVGDIEGACRELRSDGMFLVHAPVPAVSFQGRRIAWLMGRDKLLVELVERGPDGAP